MRDLARHPANAAAYRREVSRHRSKLRMTAGATLTEDEAIAEAQTLD
jgi:hypothetical protein